MEILESVKINISTDVTACAIRSLFCRVAGGELKGQNPLTDTNVNDLLDALANEAFETGRLYERSHKA